MKKIKTIVVSALLVAVAAVCFAGPFVRDGYFTHQNANIMWDRGVQNQYDISNHESRIAELEAQPPPSAQWTVVSPNDMPDGVRDRFFIYSNDTGSTQTISRIISWADTDDTDYALYECTGWNMSSCAVIQSITISTNGAQGYYNTVAGLSVDIETGHILYLDFDDTDTPNQVKGTIEFD